MLLCEVALGDMLELSTGKLIEKSYLDSIGKNSTKGYACVRACVRACVQQLVGLAGSMQLSVLTCMLVLDLGWDRLHRHPKALPICMVSHIASIT
jgi:hypothetical protein